MKDEVERIAMALESIAGSLQKIANPPMAVEPYRMPVNWGFPVKLEMDRAVLGGLRESGPNSASE